MDVKCNEESRFFESNRKEQKENLFGEKKEKEKNRKLFYHDS